MLRGLEHLQGVLLFKKKKKEEIHTDACSSGYRGNQFLILRELWGEVADGHILFWVLWVFFNTTVCRGARPSAGLWQKASSKCK